MNQIAHPQYQYLLDYAKYPGMRNSEIHDHVSHCVECQHEVDVIMDMRLLLGEVSPANNSNLNKNHISDEQLNEYVYQRLNETDKDTIDIHLNNCSDCMKQVLLFRARLDNKILLKNESSASVSSLHKKSHFKSLQVISFVLAASILAYSFVFLYPKYFTETPTIITKIAEPVLEQTSVDKISNAGLVKVKNGSINWYGAYIDTEAVGTIDMAMVSNNIQAEILAEKSARASAYAQLAEIVGGVQVTQKASYHQMLLKNDLLKIENQAFIRNAKVIKKEIKWINNEPKVSITMRLPLRGNSSLQSIVAPHIPDLNHKSHGFNTHPNTYTGFVIDSTTTNHQPALHVNLTSDYNPQTDNSSLSHLAANYYPSLKTVKTNSTAGENPYVIRAKLNSSTGLLIIDPTDMDIASSFLSETVTDQPVAVLY